MDISIFFGGKDQERGISINSARAMFEILYNVKNNINLYYVDQQMQVYKISEKNIYSNTPDDFAFLINPIADFWINFSTDLGIPLIHGEFGEDGQIQKLLENNNVPYLFSDSSSISNMFLKYTFCTMLWNNGFLKWESYLISENYHELKLLHDKYSKIILKPNNGGSSMYVFISKSYEESMQIINQYKEIQFIAEEMHNGVEFSIAVVDGKANIPVEINKNNEIFDNKSKYFPTDDVMLNIPPSFSLDKILKIQQDSEYIFKIFNAKDIIRIDGWILSNDQIIYTECNPIPSIEFNGVFAQSIYKNLYITFEQLINKKIGFSIMNLSTEHKIKIPVLFGGDSSEKEVSFLSGQNTCVKLYNSNIYEPVPFFLKNDKVYLIPFHLIFKHSIKDLLHTIENIDYYNEITRESYYIECMNFDQFISNYKYVFLALHGGDGENGVIQKKLENAGVKHNGSSAEISELCMNKYKTIEFIENNVENIYQNKRYLINIDSNNINKEIFQNNVYILKPNEDGCSTGVVKISKYEEFQQYLDAMRNNQKFVYINNKRIILPKKQDLLLESFIEVDKISVDFIDGESKIQCKTLHGWVELTVGVLNFEIFEPSLTLSKVDILTAEEKFQEGIGTNITPVPEFLISRNKIEYIKSIILDICKSLNLCTYARLDIFFNRITNEFILIEINTLPALTFATVIFQQAIYMGYSPETFIEKIIQLSLK